MNNNLFKDNIAVIISQDGKEIIVPEKKEEKFHYETFDRINKETIPGIIDDLMIDIRAFSGYNLSLITAAKDYAIFMKINNQINTNELYLAAKVDGTSDLKYLWKVMIPLALPTLISITILKMMGSWNTYMWPNLVADSQNYWLVTNGLRKFSVTVDNRPDTPVQMAAVAIVSAPLFMVFLFLRKYIMKGVSRSGIKG